MATEYRLNYTASDIDAKLGVIDGTKTYYTSEEVDERIRTSIPEIPELPEIDGTPTENSENLITSGGVYEALQNAGGGGESYTAGDLIEIKDGVIRSTLGDLIGTETDGTFVEFYHADNIEMGDQGDGTYVSGYDLTDSMLTSSIDPNKKLTVKFDLSDGTNKTFNVDITSEYDGEGTMYMGFYNCVESDGGLAKVDENLDALFFVGYVGSNEFTLNFVTLEDYTGASITIGQNTTIERKVYATLPDNALTAGNLIKIENGVVSSTLGTEITLTKEAEFLNIDSIPSDCYDNDSSQTMYSGECDYVPTMGDRVDVEITLANSDDSISFNDVEVKAYGEASCILTNSDQTIEDFDSNGIIKKDENLPAIFCMWIEEDGACYYTLISFEDITGASIKINGIATNVKVVKLPNTALTFDEEPTEDSENLVDSGSVYTAIHNVKSSFVFDSTPTPMSQNLMTSGGIYNAFNDMSGKVPQQIESYIDNNAEGAYVGKKGSGSQAEIFNSTTLNQASGDYSHAEGYDTTASGFSSHAEGGYTIASANSSHAEGSNTTASGTSSHAEGDYTIASGASSHAEGKSNGTYEITLTGNANSLSYTVTGEGNKSLIKNGRALRYGENRAIIMAYNELNSIITTDKTLSSSEALNSSAVSLGGGVAYGDYSHAEGYDTTASGSSSHAEGGYTIAIGESSHAEGYDTTASGSSSHAEGGYTTASGTSSHAEGDYTIASGASSHAEGGNTTASGRQSHAEGFYTTARGEHQHVQGRCNIEDAENEYAHIVGNGKYFWTNNGYSIEPSNAHTLDWDGNAWYAGSVEATAIILSSSTYGSVKKFKITVDDSGTLSAIETV